jgi:hypothetical protein
MLNENSANMTYSFFFVQCHQRWILIKKTANLLVDFETVEHNRKKLFTKKLSTKKCPEAKFFFTTVSVCKIFSANNLFWGHLGFE